MDDGLLGIQAKGVQKFHIQSLSVRDNGLMEGEVNFIEPEPERRLSARYHILRSVLSRLLEQVKSVYPNYDEQSLDYASWVGQRLSELLPLELVEKQALLECNDPNERLDSLLAYLPRFQKD